MGLNGFNFGFVLVRSMTVGTPSRLARGTTIGDRPGREISITGGRLLGFGLYAQHDAFFCACQLYWSGPRRTSVNPGVASPTLSPSPPTRHAREHERNVVTGVGIEITPARKNRQPRRHAASACGAVFQQLYAGSAIGAQCGQPNSGHWRIVRTVPVVLNGSMQRPGLARFGHSGRQYRYLKLERSVHMALTLDLIYKNVEVRGSLCHCLAVVTLGADQSGGNELQRSDLRPG